MAQIVYRGNTKPGRAGVAVRGGVQTNLFRLSLPSTNVVFSQYDVREYQHYPPFFSFPHHGPIHRTGIQLPGGRTNKANENNSKPVPKRFFKPVIDYLQKRSQYAHLFNPPGAYDGVASLYIPNSRIGQGAPFELNIPRDMHEGVGDTIIVHLTFVDTIDSGLVSAVMKGRSNPDGSLKVVNAINALVRMAPHEQTNEFPLTTKRAFFSERSPHDLKNGLLLFTGIHSSVRPVLGSLVLNLDTTSIVTYRPGPLLGFCLDVLGKQNVRDMTPQSIRNAKKLMDLRKGLRRVKVCYSRAHPLYHQQMTAGMPKHYSIADITLQGANVESFSYHNQQTDQVQHISIRNYFLQRYNIELRHPDIVCVRFKSRPDKETILPIELLDVVPGQVFKSVLAPEASATMISVTKRNPLDRLREITDRMKDLRYAESTYLAAAGLQINPGPERPPARMLAPPSLHFGTDRGGKHITKEPINGRWDFMNKPYHRPGVIRGWAIVAMVPPLPPNNLMPDWMLNEFGKGLHQTLLNRGLDVQIPPHIKTGINLANVAVELNGLVDQIIRDNDKWARAHKGYNGSEPALSGSQVLLVCVVVFPNPTVREAVKKWSDIDGGIATQIVKQDKMANQGNRKVDSQYLNNVALKINCKMGGSNSSITNRWFSSPVDNPPRTMILGIDVTHPAPDSESPSIAALVYNKSPFALDDYAATTRVQQKRVETVQDFAGMAKEALIQHETAFRELAKRRRIELRDKFYPPHRIIIFRDGVSEGEFQPVFTAEMRALNELFRSVNLPLPKVTFIVVGKRHHIRFIAAPDGDRDQNDKGNLKSGLVVDDQIVHPLYRDFYLQSQRPLMGTSRSAHYTVLYDDNNISQDELQSLCFDLCHMYGRATNAVSIPAPVYYADLACTRARLHLSASGFGSEASVHGDEDASTLTPQVLAQMNTKVAVHRRQKLRMYFV
ncbi:Piwi-domain-containing protein [Clavulina sp. PMI_390]|nr:Piwi-domain-containing protein [Clavulina sp. PMI_390]